jgi:membrane protein implicated in regulation of membrane protease activity
MLLEWSATINAWDWWAFAGILIILELILPGVFLLWLGIAASLVGILHTIFPNLGWELQVLAFAGFSIAVIFLQHIWLSHYPIATDYPNLNRRGQQYVGRVFILDTPIVNGEGKIHVDDTIWKVRGADCEIGTKVVIVGVDSTILLAKSI